VLAGDEFHRIHPAAGQTRRLSPREHYRYLRALPGWKL